MKDIRAKVIYGIQDETKDFATANIMVDIPLGMYVCKTNYGGAVAVCIKEGELEVHIIGFSGDLYGKMLDVTEMQKLSNERLLLIALAVNERLDLDDSISVKKTNEQLQMGVNQ